MSAFNSVFRTANSANLALLETELEGMAKNLVMDSSGTLQNTTGTLTLFSQSVTVAADDLLEIQAKISLSSSLATNAAALNLVVNSVLVDVHEIYALPVITTGQGALVAVQAKLYDLSGSIPIRLDLVLTSGGGTLYTKRQLIQATTTKRR
jgi:hypothetical protein